MYNESICRDVCVCVCVCVCVGVCVCVCVHVRMHAQAHTHFIVTNLCSILPSEHFLHCISWKTGSALP